MNKLISLKDKFPQKQLEIIIFRLVDGKLKIPKICSLIEENVDNLNEKSEWIVEVSLSQVFGFYILRHHEEFLYWCPMSEFDL